MRCGCHRDSPHNHPFDFCLVWSVSTREWAHAVYRHTSEASMNVGAASFEGTDRLGGVDIGFILSQTWWSVGVLVTDARRCSGNRVPGGSILPSSAFACSSHKTTTHQPAQEPIQPPVLKRSGAEAGVCSVPHLHTP